MLEKYMKNYHILKTWFLSHRGSVFSIMPLYYSRAIFTHWIQFGFTYDMIYAVMAKVPDTDDINLLALVDALKCANWEIKSWENEAVFGNIIRRKNNSNKF